MRNKTDSINSIYQKRLQEKSDSIILLQNTIINNIIGGKGPCYLIFQTSYDKKGYPIIVNESDLPLYNLDVYISDFDKLIKCKRSIRKENLIFDESCYSSCTKKFPYEIIQNGYTNFRDYYLPNNKNEGRLEIRFELKSNIEYLEHLFYEFNGISISCIIKLYVLDGKQYRFLKTIDKNNLSSKIDFDNMFNLPLLRRSFAPIYWR